MADRHEERVALVTGAGRGIGAAVARRLAADGLRVAVHYRAGRNEAEAVLADLPGEGHALVAADLGDTHQARALPDQVVAELGRLDAVVNNAGIYELHDIERLAPEAWHTAWRRTLDVNLDGPVQVLHGAVHHLKAAGGGHLVNITSRGAYRGEPDAPAYGAAKAALNSVTQSLALRLAPLGIISVAVAPGWVRTDMTAAILDSPDGQAIIDQSPLGRTAAPDEVAAVVALVLSGKADALTGSIIDLNCASYLR